MPRTVIESIHAAARTANGESLDRPVYLNGDLGLLGLVDLSGKRTVYVDVPVASIVALGKDDFWSSGDTWRTATYRLLGEGWSSAVFDYFESPTKEAPFPAPSSLYQLRLSIMGGVAECESGNHRLVAARAWLTGKYGDDAVLRGVRVRAYPIHRCVVDFLTRARCEGSDVLTATLDYRDRERWRVDEKPIQLLLKTSKEPHAIYAWVDDQLCLLKDERTFLQRRFPNRFPSVMDRCGWRTISLAIVKGLLDDAWLAAQLATAETWADP